MAKAGSELHKNHRKRMKEKYYRYGGDIFSDHELIEMLLFGYVPRINTNPAAHELINRAGSLQELLKMPSEEILKTKRITRKAADCLPHILPAVYDAVMRENAWARGADWNNAPLHNTFSDFVAFASKLSGGELCVCAYGGDRTMGEILKFNKESPDFRKFAELAYYFRVRRLCIAEKAEFVSPSSYGHCRIVLEKADLSIAHYLIFAPDRCYDFATGRFISLD